MQPTRLIIAFKAYLSDLQAIFKLATDTQSRLRLSLDFALSRIIVLVPQRWRNRVREVRFRGDIKIHYRLNKGDLHSIREIWFQENYRLPFESSSGTLLDLGANIGMASLWLVKTYPLTTVIAVEPDPSNAALVRQNLELNGITNHVIEAAVGPRDGTARFEFNELSNLGRISENGSPVPMITVGAIVKQFAVTRFALVKIDIEGGEQALFDGPIEWLALTDAIVIELHPTIVDSRLTSRVCSGGLRHIPSHSFVPDNLDCFERVK